MKELNVSGRFLLFFHKYLAYDSWVIENSAKGFYILPYDDGLDPGKLSVEGKD